MKLHCSDVLKEMAQHDLRLVVEHALPHRKLKHDVITLRAADGKHVKLKSPRFAGSYWSSDIMIPRPFLDNYLRSGLVFEEDRKPDRTVYKLTSGA